MPNVGELIAGLLDLIGRVLGESELRLGFGPTLAVLGVLLVLLHLVARPTTRWTTRDLGGLAGVGRAMALAAEAGSTAVLSLGTAGLVRSTEAARRIQTLAALPLLDHVARAAARSGVPLRVPTNDPIAALVAGAVLEGAHVRAGSAERSGRSRADYIGEGRVTAAGRALADRTPSSAAFVIGSLGEEGILLLDGLAARSSAVTAGTADAGQATSVLLESDHAMIGPEIFLAPGDVRAGGGERNVVLATNRVVLLALAAILIGSLLALANIVDPRGWLVGPG